MSEFQQNNSASWVKFMTLPAKRHENGNLIIRGASPLILTNLLKSLVELSGIEPLTSTMPL